MNSRDSSGGIVNRPPTKMRRRTVDKHHLMSSILFRYRDHYHIELEGLNASLCVDRGTLNIVALNFQLRVFCLVLVVVCHMVTLT